MTKFPISFPSPAMVIPKEDLPIVFEARAIIHEAKKADVWIFGGGINEGI